MPGEGFEPPTFGLQNRCTTTVLTRQKYLRSTYYTNCRVSNYTICHPFATLAVRERRPKRGVDTLGGIFLQAWDGVTIRVHRDRD
jgi:hypothetical protein